MCKLDWAVFLVAFLLPVFVVSEGQAQSFDCSKASLTVEIAICKDTHLTALDAEFSAKYRAVSNDMWQDDPKEFYEVRDRARNFLTKRNQCGDSVPCIAQAYQDIIGYLSQYAAAQDVAIIPQVASPHSTQQPDSPGSDSAPSSNELSGMSPSPSQGSKYPGEAPTTSSLNDGRVANPATEESNGTQAAPERVTKPRATPDLVPSERRPPKGENTLFLIVAIYAAIAGLICLPVVRPPFANWYNSSAWFVVGRGPVNILLKTIWYRLGYEVFVFVISCAFGAIGGWIFVIYNFQRRKNREHPT